MSDTSDDGSKRVAATQRLDAPWLNTADLARVFDALDAAGFTARAVGGSVRDALLGQIRPGTAVKADLTDIDLATTATPDQTIAAMANAGLRTIPTGVAHGTVTVIAGATAFEVTTLRADVRTDGRHADVRFTTDWHADASRRDLTINAIYCDRDGRLHDPLNGIGDLSARHLRLIGDANTRLQEDYLRILRYFRFAAQLPDMDVTEADLRACTQERDGLKRLSAERVRAELLKLLTRPGAVESVRLMQRHGILAVLLPTVANPDRLQRVCAIESALTQAQGDDCDDTPASAILRLAALSICTTNDSHRLATRLRLSNDEAALLDRLATHIEQPQSWRTASWRFCSGEAVA